MDARSSITQSDSISNTDRTAGNGGLNSTTVNPYNRHHRHRCFSLNSTNIDNPTNSERHQKDDEAADVDEYSRFKETDKRKEEHTQSGSNTIVKSILGSNGNVYTINEFLKEYVPCYPLENVQHLSRASSVDKVQNSSTETTVNDHLQNQLEYLLIAVPITDGRNNDHRKNNNLKHENGALDRLHSIRLPIRCDQSLTSLIDECIWYLTQRRELKRLEINADPKKSSNSSLNNRSAFGSRNNKFNNILCQGYYVASDIVGTNKSIAVNNKSSYSLPSSSSSLHRIGLKTNNNSNMIQMQLNSAVDFCKTSTLFRYLHKYLGDDILRYILLNCSLFVPLLDNSNLDKGIDRKINLLLSQSFHDDNNDDADVEVSYEHDNYSECACTEKILDAKSIIFSKLNYFQVTGPPITIMASYSGTVNAKQQSSVVEKRTKIIQKKGGVVEATTGSQWNIPNENENEKKGCKGLSIPKNEVVANDKQRNRKRKRQKNVQRTSISVPLSLEPTSFVSRRSLFYSSSYIDHIKNGKNIFPPNHVLSVTISQNNDDPEFTSRNHPCTMDTSTTMNQPTKLNESNSTNGNPGQLLFSAITDEYYKNIVTNANHKTSLVGESICFQIVKRHQTFDYLRLLERCCPLPDVYTKARQQNQIERRNSNHSRLSTSLKLEEIPSLFTPEDSIVLFLKSCIHYIFPNEFWGSCIGNNKSSQSKITTNGVRIVKRTGKMTSVDCCNNKSLFLNALVPCFVHLSRNEMLSNKALIHKVQILNMKWLLPAKSDIRKAINDVATIDEQNSTHQDENNELAQLIQTHLNRVKNINRLEHERLTLLVLCTYRWIIRSYIIPLLQCFFYVTESEMYGKRVLYYRKPIWTLFRNLSINKLVHSLNDRRKSEETMKCKKRKHSTSSVPSENETPEDDTNIIPIGVSSMKQKQFLELREDDAVQLLSKKEMGVSNLRLLPKATGVRPIATLCKLDDSFYKSNTKNVAANIDSSKVHLNKNNSNSQDECFPMLLVESEDNHLDNNVMIPQPKETKQKHIIPPTTSKPLVPTNIALNDIFEVLKYELVQKQDLFGCGLSGLHFFYDRYRTFIRNVSQNQLVHDQNNNTNNDNVPKTKLPLLYFASVDIKHCYDNINQEHMLHLLDTILTQEEYIIQKFTTVHGATSSTSNNTSRITCRPKKLVNPTSCVQPLFKYIQTASSTVQRTVFVDGVTCIVLKKGSILKQIREHLTSHIVTIDGRHGKRFLLQVKGIPQGSILSSLLCNFYYADMEKRLFQKKKQDTSIGNNHVDLMVRLTDDFMFISTDKSACQEFLDIMEKGEPQFGAEINHEKTKVSCPSLRINTESLSSNHNTQEPDVSVECSERMSVGSSNNHPTTMFQTNHHHDINSSWFSWCGMLFHTKTGEVKIDYNRYVGGQPSHSLTINRTNNEGTSLVNQMKGFVRPRCVPILYDTSINCTFYTQAMNFYEMITLGAIKTAMYVKGMSKIGSSATFNANYLLSCVESTILYAYKLIRQRLIQEVKKVSACSSSLSFDDNNKTILPSTKLTQRLSLSIGWQSFVDVFQKVKHIQGLELFYAALGRKKETSIAHSKQIQCWLRQSNHLLFDQIIQECDCS